MATIYLYTLGRRDRTTLLKAEGLTAAGDPSPDPSTCRGCRPADVEPGLAFVDGMASVDRYPRMDGFEYPGYLQAPPLIQTGTQSSTPKKNRRGYRLTEVSDVAT